MIAATVCSGMGAPELAMPEWQWVLQSEIEPAPRSVLMARFGAEDARLARTRTGPALWGDFTALRVRHLRRLGIALPEWIVAGTPCQSFSVAGKRGSLGDDRGNLTLEFLRLVHALRRAGSLRGITWENVLGILNTPDNAFGCFLGALVGGDDALLPGARPAAGRSNRGWRWRPGGRWPVLDDDGNETGRFVERAACHVPVWPRAGMVAGPFGRAAWRVLDAQYFGVPQRRRRVILVADFGDGPDPAAVLFEPRSVPGNLAAGGGAGEDVAGTVAGGARKRGGYSADDIPAVAATLTGSAGGVSGKDCPGGRLAFGGGNTSGPIPVAAALAAHGRRQDFEVETFVAEVAPTLTRNPHGDNESREAMLVTHALRGEGFDASEDGTGRGTPLVPVAFDTTQITSAANFSNPKPGDPCPPLAAGAHPPAIAFDCLGTQVQVSTDGVMPPLRSLGRSGSDQNAGGHAAVSISENSNGYAWEGDVNPTLQARAQSGSSSQFDGVRTQAGVRRLTPRECERLQGAADDHTLVPHRGKPMADGPRHKMAGNSMAMPMMRWAGRRVDAVMAGRLVA